MIDILMGFLDGANFPKLDYLHVVQKQFLWEFVSGFRFLYLLMDEGMHNTDTAVHGKSGGHFFVTFVKMESVELKYMGEWGEFG